MARPAYNPDLDGSRTPRQHERAQKTWQRERQAEQQRRAKKSGRRHSRAQHAGRAK